MLKTGRPGPGHGVHVMCQHLITEQSCGHVDEVSLAFYSQQGSEP